MAHRLHPLPRRWRRCRVPAFDTRMHAIIAQELRFLCKNTFRILCFKAFFLCPDVACTRAINYLWLVDRGTARDSLKVKSSASTVWARKLKSKACRNFSFEDVSSLSVNREKSFPSLPPNRRQTHGVKGGRSFQKKRKKKVSC